MYLLDSNVFIEAKNTYLGFDTAPGFWAWIEDAHERGRLASVDAVRKELVNQDDELASWAQDLPPSFWIGPHPDLVASLRSLASWAMKPEHQYRPAARSTFLASADYELIAAAHAGHHVAVTREKSEPESKKRIAIPDVCMAHGVPYTSPFTVYRAEGLKLIRPAQ